MRLVVCALSDLEAQARRVRPAGVVSLLSPGQTAPPVAGDPPRLILGFNDIAEPRDGLRLPDPAIIPKLLAFASALPADATLLLHCWMGISRSPAAAFILACAQDPARPEAEVAAALRQAAPSATPNPLLVGLADRHLARDGRMSAAIAAIGRGRDAAQGHPFTLQTGRADPERA